MHLAELLRLGARPGAGLLLALTDRCPLSCAHCSTDSGPDAPQYPAAPLRRLLGTFTAAAHPDTILISGGEPLLRPALVAEVNAAAHGCGARTALFSGLFFARGGGRVPPPVRRAISGLSHFAASIDRYHEREVSRPDALAALTVIVDCVPGVSVHVTDPEPDGAYVSGLVAELRARFGDRVPVLVTPLRPTGRARSLPPPNAEHRIPAAALDDPPTLGPCPFAAWPLVDIDGTVYACSRQSKVRGSGSAHLVLGHAARDDWATLRARSLSDPLLRAVRTLGPIRTSRRFATTPPDAPQGSATCGAGACATCLTLGAEAALTDRVTRYLDSPAGRFVESAVHTMTAAAPAAALARRSGAVGAEFAETGRLRHD